MPQPTTWNIITSITSALALIISLITLFLTKLKSFKGIVIPSRRISLAWVTDEASAVPGIFVECQFINQGAKPGKIEDVIVELQNVDGGERIPYLAFLTRSDIVDFYVEEGESEQSFQDFSTVWLNPGENKNITIVFKSNKAEINLTASNTYRLSLFYSGDNVRKIIWRKIVKWNKSPLEVIFQVNENTLQVWENHQTVRIESKEINENRRDIFSNWDSF